MRFKEAQAVGNGQSGDPGTGLHLLFHCKSSCPESGMLSCMEEAKREKRPTQMLVEMCMTEE